MLSRFSYTVSRMIQRSSFFLALLAHFFLFSGISFVWVTPTKLFQFEKKDTPALDIPAYLYQPPPAAPVSAPVLTPAPLPQKIVPIISKPQPASKIGLEKSVILPQHPLKSLNFKQAIALSPSKYTEPVHLIGDKKIAKPLLVLLGKALTRHLIYPKSALDFNVKGTAVIGFLLDPSGQVTRVQLLQSSRADVLDQAAMSAAQAISPVHSASAYINNPRYMVIGIIFE